MNRTRPEGHRSLRKQAQRTALMRRVLYDRLPLSGPVRVLDVGCGDGSVTADLVDRGLRIVAVDADAARARRARQRLPGAAPVIVADAHRLPFSDHAFDVAICHLLLMWTQEPAQVVAEMRRVTRPGGTVVAAMEPDYGGKIHEPENPVVDHVFADTAIRARGGDPHMGRKLRALFVLAGLATETGLLNPVVPSCEEDLLAYQAERQMYRAMLAASGLAHAQIDDWEQQYLASLRQGSQMNFLPMFYAVGRVPVDPGR